MRSYVFENVTDAVINELKNRISSQIALHIPNASVTSLKVSLDSGSSTSIPALRISLTLKERNTNELIPLEILT